MIPYKTIEEYVHAHVTIPEEVKPVYESEINVNGEKIYMEHDDPSVFSVYNGPYNSVHTKIKNKKEYDDYSETIIGIVNRVEYCWYMIFRDIWKDLPEDVFQKCYKQAWDKAHPIGGWDKIPEVMEEIVKNNEQKT
jgi:hypothetical protein